MKKQILTFLFLSIMSFGVFAQGTVTGKVTDSEGEPLIGASVVVKGTSVGTVTDLDGAYTLSASGNDILVVSYIGYSNKDEPVNGRKVVDIILQTGVELTEIVVTGYGTSSKRNLTGNIAKIKSEEILNVPVASVDQALQGRAAGVFVNAQSGKLGQAVTVRVRGNSSISANSQPLYVLDGIPITTNDQSSYGGDMNPLTDLNPNDIESIEVLKDASAGAIYGSRAANGVVLITTKRGKSGKTSVSFNVQTGYSEATKRVAMLNSEQYAELILEGAAYRDNLDKTPITDPDSWTTYVKNDVMGYYSYGKWASDPTKTYE